MTLLLQNIKFFDKPLIKVDHQFKLTLLAKKEDQ